MYNACIMEGYSPKDVENLKSCQIHRGNALIKRFRNEFRNVLKLMTSRINEHTHLHYMRVIDFEDI